MGFDSFSEIERESPVRVVRRVNGADTPFEYCPAESRVSFGLRFSGDVRFSEAYFYLGNDDGVIVRGDRTECVRENGTVTFNTAEYTLGRGLYFFHFELPSDSGGLLYTCEEAAGCTLRDTFSGEWQLLVYEPSSAPAPLPGNGIIYHIFIDRFRKAGDVPRREDAAYFGVWGGMPEYAGKRGGFLRNNTFFGGTLYGVIEKLDYIKSLGAEMIYLSPVFRAYSNHRYDVGDFMAVDECIGGDAALSLLVAEAEKAGMKVMLDGVFNHVGDDSRYFNKYGKYDSLGAYQSPDSPYYDWFTFFNYPDSYDCWWGISNLPKIKKVDSYRSFITDDVIPRYSAMGVGGWRLDVVDEYSGDFLESITASAKKAGGALVIGEVWEDASCKVAYGERKNYLCGGRLDGVTNYPLRDALIAFMTGKDTRALAHTLYEQYRRYPAQNRRVMMNLLGSHDTVRIINALSGRDGEGLTEDEKAALTLSADERARAVKMLKAAYLFICTQTGIPCLYYGDETALEGCSDPFCRRPFPWDTADASLTEYFSRCASLRREYGLGLYLGEEFLDTPDGVFAAEYYSADCLYTVLLNSGTENFSFLLKGLYKDIFDNVIYENEVTVPPVSCMVLVKKVWEHGIGGVSDG